MVNPKSPIRVVMNAFFPALIADLFQEPESDQQVAAEANAFPSHEHQNDVCGQHQRKHEENEQIHVGKEAVVAFLVRHVADRNRCARAN